MRSLMLHWCVLVVLWSLNAFAQSGSAQTTNLVFIYIHGFGGDGLLGVWLVETLLQVLSI